MSTAVSTAANIPANPSPRPQDNHAHLRTEVEHELDLLLSRHSAAAQTYGEQFSHLWSRAARQVRGGKLVRPVLLLETYDALRHTPSTEPTPTAYAPFGDRKQVVRVAAAVEALHYAFLLHDDVIDGDVTRRGRLNLIGELAQATGHRPPNQAKHWAQTGAILAGDLLLAAAHQQFARLEVPTPTRLQLLDLLEHSIVETTAGELADVGLSDGVISPDLSTVLAMTQRKTASYTFELTLRAAVILAGGSQHVENTLSRAGQHLGLAYQLQDDLLSTFGDATKHGKDPYADLRSGKQTAVICMARFTSAWPSIEAHFGNRHLSEETAQHVGNLLVQCGAQRQVQELIDEQLRAYYQLVAGNDQAPQIPTRVRQVLLDLVHRLQRRQS